MNFARLTTILLLTAFIGLAVFGFAFMGTHEMGEQENCIASIGQTTLCSHQDAFAMAELHAGFFQRLTGITLLLTLLAFAWIALKKISPQKQVRIIGRIIHQTDLVFRKSHEPFLRWFSFHSQIA